MITNASNDSKYFDLAKSPLFIDDFYSRRDEVSSLFPEGATKIFMPFTHNADPFWVGKIKNGWLNDPYAPTVALLYVIRDYPKEFYFTLTSLTIKKIDDFINLRLKFNRLYRKLSHGHGHGREKGLCSVDELIMLAALFYVLQTSSATMDGIKLDSDLNFVSNWSGYRSKMRLTPTVLAHYQVKLSSVFLADMGYEQFIFRGMNYTDEQTLWFVRCPQFGREDDNFKLSNFVSIVEKMSLVKKRGGKCLIICEYDKGLVKFVKQFFDFTSFSDSIVKNSDFYLYDDLVRNNIIFSNYLLDV